MVYPTCALIGLGGRGVIKTETEVAARVRLYMLTPLYADVRSHPSGSSATQPLAASEESWHHMFIYDVINNVVSANQHFASTFSMQIFKFQRRSCNLSLLLSLCRQNAPESLLAGLLRC